MRRSIKASRENVMSKETMQNAGNRRRKSLKPIMARLSAASSRRRSAARSARCCLAAPPFYRRRSLWACWASRSARSSTERSCIGRNCPNADNVIDYQSLERALREKPVPTFSRRALADFVPGAAHGDTAGPGACVWSVRGVKTWRLRLVEARPLFFCLVHRHRLGCRAPNAAPTRAI